MERTIEQRFEDFVCKIIISDTNPETGKPVRDGFSFFAAFIRRDGEEKYGKSGLISNELVDDKKYFSDYLTTVFFDDLKTDYLKALGEHK